MNFMTGGKTKSFILKTPISIAILIFLALQFIVRLYIYKPIKPCVFKSFIDNTKYYIVCEYVEVTGFYWRIKYDRDGDVKDKYVKLTGRNFNNDGTDYLAYQLVHSSCEFVFYGDFIENSINPSFDALFDSEEYLTFNVKDWDILGPIFRSSNSLFDMLAEPKLYLYRNDFCCADNNA